MKTQACIEEGVVFTSILRVNFPRVFGDSWFSWVSHGQGLPVRYPQNTLFCYFGLSAPPFLHPHYIYSYYLYIVRSAFQRENLSKHIWELEIVIPTIIYTSFVVFLILLPLYIHILERLIAQILTTPNLSVKWGFSGILLVNISNIIKKIIYE